MPQGLRGATATVGSGSMSSAEPGYEDGLSLCIPAYNEEMTIHQVVIEASKLLERLPFPGEILVIDDCSTDRTWEILSNLTPMLPGLQIRRHPVNQGIAATFAELYRWAKKDWVFLNSADGQWPMSAALDLLPMTHAYDIIVARRADKHYRLGRRLTSWMFNFLPLIFFFTRTFDAGSVKLARRSVYDIPIISSGVFAEAERIIRAKRLGYRIGVKSVTHFPRRSGKASGAKPSLVLEASWDLLKCWLDIVILRNSNEPFKGDDSRPWHYEDRKKR